MSQLKKISLIVCDVMSSWKEVKSIKFIFMRLLLVLITTLQETIDFVWNVNSLKTCQIEADLL